ncbi:HNH endonuclease [Chloroflexota bacterium]
MKSQERVHHINRDKTDNRRSNLWVFKSQEQHHTTHKKDKKRFGFW